jgi:KTSC domain
MMRRIQERPLPNRSVGERMIRIPVSSSNIASIGYDQKTRTLEVEFLKGGVYQYFDVPQAVYEEFISAESKGKYLADQIKGNYRYARV